MARIVPAKPACTTDAEETALLELERGLGDDFVVIQRGPLDGTLLVVHPDHGICAVACMPGQHSFDPDAEAWDMGDPAETARTAARRLGPLATAPVAAIAWFPDTQDTAPDAMAGQSAPRVAFQDQGGSLPGMVSSALASSRTIGDAAVDALIRWASPSATSYERGQVTEAQRRWRESRGETLSANAITEGPAAEARANPSLQQAITSALTQEAVIPLPATPAASELGKTVNTPTGTLVTVAHEGGIVTGAVQSPARPGPPPLDGPDITIDDPLILLLRQAAENVSAQRPIFLTGLQIDPEELVSPDFLLPALLVAAAQDWAPVVVSKAGRGGFLMRMRTDPDAILGYRIAALEPSAPLLLMLPVVDRIRRAAKIAHNGAEVLNMDETVQMFKRWLETNNLDAEVIGDIDMRIALKTE